MKAALSIVLVGMLVMVPLQQVQAQTAQQEAVGVHQALSPDSAAHRLRVQPLTEAGALLWVAPDRVAPNPGAHEPTETSTQQVAKTAFPVTAFIVIIAVVVVLYCWTACHYKRFGEN